MIDHDYLRVICATILAAGVAVMTQDPSFRWGPSAETAAVPQSAYSDLMLVLHQDRVGDRARQFKEDVKQQWSNFTDDDLMEMDANYDQFVAKVRQRYGHRMEEFQRWVSEWITHSSVGSPLRFGHG